MAEARRKFDVLAEIGDDRSRFQDAKGLKAYAGTAPITRASGRRHAVTRRLVRNKRLCQAGYLWAFSLLTASPEPAPTTTKRGELPDPGQRGQHPGPRVCLRVRRLRRGDICY